MNYLLERITRKNWLELLTITVLMTVCLFLLYHLVLSFVYYEDFNATIMERRPSPNLTAVWSAMIIGTLLVLADVLICIHWFDSLEDS